MSNPSAKQQLLDFCTEWLRDPQRGDDIYGLRSARGNFDLTVSLIRAALTDQHHKNQDGGI